jgi:HD-GYP domain-containing protein (c-di-GMP phosphodiesterase class II)
MNKIYKPLSNFLNKFRLFKEKKRILPKKDRAARKIDSLDSIHELINSFNKINSRLEKEIKEMELSNDHMRRVLSEIAMTMTFSQDINKILDTIINIAIKALDAGKGLVLIKSKKDSKLLVKSAVGFDKELLDNKEIEPEDGIIGWVIKNGKPVILPEGDKDSQFKKISNLEIGTQSTICTPIVLSRKKIGAIIISNKKHGTKFSSDDLIILNNLSAQTAIALENAMLRENIENTYFETISALAIAVESKDKYTKGHSIRVGKIASAIAREMSLDQRKIEEIGYAATLHDIGKIGIMDRILHKGKLTPEEFEIIKQHPEIGENIIRPVASLSRLCPILRHHHERVDGNGYPDNLKGDEIPLEARILLVADAFDAMTSSRPYRKAMSIYDAVEEIKRNAGYQFDRDIVTNFLNYLPKSNFSQAVLH